MLRLSPLRTLANAENLKHIWSKDGRYLILIVKYLLKKKYSNDVIVIDITTNAFKLGFIQF